MLKSIYASSALACLADLCSCREVAEDDAIIRKIVGAPSHFHQPAARTAAFEERAESKGLPFQRFHKYFELR